MQIHNIVETLAKHPQGRFVDIAAFNGAAFAAGAISGESPYWEMHPHTDEFFYVLEGHLEMSLLEEATASCYSAIAGEMFVIPKGIWHKPAAPQGCKFIYLTPGETLHSEADDPRADSTNQ